jgi:hypothetical protein
VELTWTASTDNVGVDHYVVRRALVASGTPGPFVEVGSPTATTYTDATVEGGTAYRYEVVAVDPTGNASDPSDPAGVTTPTAIELHGTWTAFGKDQFYLAFALPPAAEEGDVLIASLDLRGTPVITPPAGWTLVRSDAVGSMLTKATYWHLVGPSEPASYDWTFDTMVTATGTLLAYGGVDGTAPIDDHGGQSATNSTSVAAPSVTTVVDGSVVVALFGQAVNGSITEPAGMTEQAEIAVGGSGPKAVSEAADELRPTAGPTGTRTATSSKRSALIGQLLALRPMP